MTLLCSYCNEPASLVNSKVIYGKSYGTLWICFPCGAYVGCHKGTDTPLGTLANKELRRWRMLAHSAFDPLWKNGVRRTRAYAWLARKLGIKVDECHIAMFDIETCKLVIEAVAMHGHTLTQPRRKT